MPITWVHLSELQIDASDSYQADVVRDALVELVQGRQRGGMSPDFIVVTGDLAFSGAEAEYVRVDTFMTRLLEAAGLGGRRERLIVVPGNHDVDAGLIRRLPRLAEKESAWFFGPEGRRDRERHFEGQGAYRAWHDGFFDTIGRRSPGDTTCGEVITLNASGSSVAILPINTALLAVDDDDHGRLWIGLRALRPAVEALAAAPADLRVAVMHHPFEWLAPAERELASRLISEVADLVLHGHQREPTAEVVQGALRAAAGACAGAPQRRPCVFFGSADLGVVRLQPYTFAPHLGRWVVDTSVFPDAPEYRGTFTLIRQARIREAAHRPLVSRHQLFPGRREREYPPEQERRLLTIRGEVRGDLVEWCYLVHDEERPVDTTMIGGVADVARKARSWLEAPSPATSLEVGHKLARLLLGEPGRAGFQRLLRRLFRRAEDALDLVLGPSYGPVRCRVITESAALRALPWSLLAVDGHYLADDGWTFELAEPSGPDEPVLRVHLTGPCTVLVVAPRAGPAHLDADRHVREIDELLARIWPLEAERGRLLQYRLLARTRAEIDAVLRVHAPQVVYILGQVYAQDPPQLRLDRGAGSEIADLRDLSARLACARVLFINAVGSELDVLAASRLAGPACVVVPIAGTDAAAATDTGLAWLEALLRRGHSPVGALDVVQRERSGGRATAMIASTWYRSWRTTVAPTEDYVGKVEAYLDRTAQRTQLFDKVLDLVKSSRRVLSVIAPAPPDQRPEGLGELLHNYVHDQIEPYKVRVFHEQIVLPQGDEALDLRLEGRLTRDLLAMEHGDDLGQALGRYVERGARRLGLAAGTRSVLWIEWRLGDRRAAASSELLDAWLRFGAEFLAPHCPSTLQVVSLLIVVASARGCSAIEDYYTREIPTHLAARLSSASSGYVVLPRPSDVGLHDIDDYLHRRSSCAGDLVAAVAAAIFQRTAGNFNATVHMLQEIERSGTWLSIAAEAPPPRPNSRKPRIFE